MWEYKFMASFGYEEKMVEISEVSGGGGLMFHVMVEKYYKGSIFKKADNAWRWHSPSRSLTEEDGNALIEIVKKNLSKPIETENDKEGTKSYLY